jgi:hypothetical protein
MNPTGRNTDVTVILHAGRLTSPVTNLRLPATTLVPNHALRGAVTAYTAGILGRSANPNR